MRMRGKVLPIVMHGDGRDEEEMLMMRHRKRIKHRLFVLRSWIKTGRKWGDWYRQEKGTSLTEEERRQVFQEIRRLEEERMQLNLTKSHAPA